MRDGDRGKLQFIEINCKHSCFYGEVEMEAVALDEFELNAGGKRDFPDKQPERSQGRRQVLRTTQLKHCLRGFTDFRYMGNHVPCTVNYFSRHCLSKILIMLKLNKMAL